LGRSATLDKNYEARFNPNNNHINNMYLNFGNRNSYWNDNSETFLEVIRSYSKLNGFWWCSESMLKLLIRSLALLLLTSLAHAEQRYFYDSLGRLAAEKRRDCQPVSAHSATAPKMSQEQTGPLWMDIFVR
jgi:hypothetical protein